MGDKEILAELKQCYELLEDIIDNADSEQLKSVKELMQTENILAEKYKEVYEKIKQEEDISLYYEEDLQISEQIYSDYIDKNGEYRTHADFDNKKWWEDYNFLTEF